MSRAHLVALIVVLLILLAFATVNGERVGINAPFAGQVFETPLFLVMIAFYLLGMLSGWSVVGFFRWSLGRRSKD